MSEKIVIPKMKLEETKIACINEMRSIQSKRETSVFHLIASFLYTELKNYYILSFVGAILLFISVCLIESPSLIQAGVSVYLFLIVIIGIYEMYKNSYYGMSELLATSTIQPQKAIVYKTSAILILEMILFVVVEVLCSLYLKLNLSNLYFSLLLPAILIAVLSNIMIDFIGNTILGISLSIGLYVFIVSIVSYIDVLIRIRSEYIVIAFAVSVVCYVFSALFQLQRKEGRRLWN